MADHPDAGYNQRMTDLQAALGASQMHRAESIVAERRHLAAIYDEAFADLHWLKTPVALAGMSLPELPLPLRSRAGARGPSELRSASALPSPSEAQCLDGILTATGCIDSSCNSCSAYPQLLPR